MARSKFHFSHYFDLRDFPYREIFGHSKVVWDILPELKSLVHENFAKKLKTSNKNLKDIFIGKGTVIEDGVKINGHVLIGSNCRISHAAFLRENCIIGDNVTIGHGVEIKNSVICNNSTVAHLNYIGDSVIGNSVNISGGAITANFRLDKRMIQIINGGERINTKLRKFGAIIGDGSIIGVNAVLNPGSILGKNTLVYPLISVKGVYKDGEIIK